MIVDLGACGGRAGNASNLVVVELIVVAKVECQLLFGGKLLYGFLKFHRHLVGIVDIAVGCHSSHIGGFAFHRHHLLAPFADAPQGLVCSYLVYPAAQRAVGPVLMQ